MWASGGNCTKSSSARDQHRAFLACRVSRRSMRAPFRKSITTARCHHPVGTVHGRTGEQGDGNVISEVPHGRRVSQPLRSPSWSGNYEAPDSSAARLTIFVRVAVFWRRNTRARSRSTWRRSSTLAWCRSENRQCRPGDGASSGDGRRCRHPCEADQSTAGADHPPRSGEN